MNAEFNSRHIYKKNASNREKKATSEFMFTEASENCINTFTIRNDPKINK